MHSWGGGSIGDNYIGPGLEAGLRQYSKTRRFYFELNANTAYLRIKNGELYDQEHEDHPGLQQKINSSERYDVGIRFIVGVQTGREMKDHPLKKFYLSAMQLSAGLRYTWVSTDMGPVYRINTTQLEPYVNCVATQPALLFSNDLIPNGQYLLPVFQFGLIFGLGY